MNYYELIKEELINNDVYKKEEDIVKLEEVKFE